MSFVDNISKQTGIEKDVLEKEYNDLKASMKKSNPDISDINLKSSSERRFTALYRSLIKNGATEWLGYVVGYDDANDRMAYKHKKALTAFMQNKEEAIRQGLTDVNGIPLETKDNKNKGRELRPFIARSIYGICYAKDKDPKPFVMTYASDDPKKIPIPPIGKLIKFMARLNTQRTTNDAYNLDGKMDITKFEEAKDPTAPSFDDAILKIYKPVKSLNGVPEYTNIVYECILDSLDLENSFGNKRMTVAPPDATTLDAPSTMVFMPTSYNFDQVEGLSEGALVLVFGRMGKTREDGSNSINGCGVWVYPAERIATTPKTTKEEVAKTRW